MEDMMADNQDKAGKGKRQGKDVPDQSGTRNSQSASGGTAQGSGQHTGGPGAGTSRESGIVHSPAEANVFPAGAAQTSHGSAGGRPVPGGSAGPSAAGTPDEGRLGGSGGTSASGTTGNDPDR
jgi:hypothetical protein